MATTVSAILQAVMNVEETLDANALPSIASRTIKHTALDVQVMLNAVTTPNVSMHATRRISASASGTIDLTALAATEGTVTALGKKLVAMRITSTGANAFAIMVGGVNGYEIGGSPITVQPGGTVLYYFADGLTDVDGTHKNLTYVSNVANVTDVTLLLG